MKTNLELIKCKANDGNEIDIKRKARPTTKMKISSITLGC
jgi:hypothetical protein